MAPTTQAVRKKHQQFLKVGAGGKLVKITKKKGEKNERKRRSGRGKI